MSNFESLQSSIFGYLNTHDLLLPYSLRNGSMVMAKKIVFENIADSDSTTLTT